MGSSSSKQRGRSKKDKKSARKDTAPRTTNISNPIPGTFPNMQPLPAIYHRRASDRRPPSPPRASSARMSRASSHRASTAETINVFMEPPIANPVTQDSPYAQSALYQLPPSTYEPAAPQPTRRSRPASSSSGGEARRSAPPSRQAAAYQLPATTYRPAPSAYQQLPATTYQPAPPSLSRATSSAGQSRRQSVDDGRRARPSSGQDRRRSVDARGRRSTAQRPGSSGASKRYYPPSSSKGDPRTVRTRNTTENAAQWRQ